VVQGGRHAKARLNGRFAPVPRRATDPPGGTLQSIPKPVGITAADLEERAMRRAYPVEVLEEADGVT
jgi:hypothetical protein